jgi:hypothetical protein
MKGEQKMKKLIFSLAVVVLFAAMSQFAFANVYAAHLSAERVTGGYDLTYRLNEAASTATVEILDGVTVIRTLTGGTAKGANVVFWDGQDSSAVDVPDGLYAWRVTAVDSVGHSSWELISDIVPIQTQFYSPRGVAVNKDQTSDYFGTVYVAEWIAGTVTALTGSRTTTEGVYILSNDLEDVIVGQGDVALVGSINPYRFDIYDGKLYIADWSDSTSGVYRVNGDGSGLVEILANVNRDGSGLCDNHGSVNAVLLEDPGSGLVLYTRDEDFLLDTAVDVDGDILRYDIGNAISYAPLPVKEAEDGDYTVNTSAANFDMDYAGNWWFAQYRWTGSAGSPHIWRHTVSTGVVDVDAMSVLPAQATCMGGMVMTDTKDVIVCIGWNKLVWYDIATNTVLLNIDTTGLDNGGSNRGGAFDAAGNLYATNSSNERLFVYSPPDGANQFTTTSSEEGSVMVGVWANARTWQTYF